MTRDDHRLERDLILAPNEYAYLLDETKGNVINYVGPHKTSLANTDQPVVFNSESKRFVRCLLDQAIHPFAIAPEGWYLVLKNPASDGKYPRPGTANTLPDLDVGRKVNIPGPVSFAPWPGQMIRIIQGHHLRSNQYLIVRVYDEEAARANWGQAVIKPQTAVAADADTAEIPPTVDADTAIVKPDEEMPDLTLGKQLVIKGTSVSFYIPPTGIEVVRDEEGHYVRDAITLERLEYCILLGEDGNKRYIRGPEVVFPRPTEMFVEKNGARKFKAIELNEISGLYVKVIAPYAENEQQYNVGDELFITGKEQMIYFPRPEHAIIRYGDREVNYAVAVPAGEARYVLNRLTGQIDLRRGPTMLLPDPRYEVIVRRVLDLDQVRLWFPGNEEALTYNKQLLALTQTGDDYISEGDMRRTAKKSLPEKAAGAGVASTFAGDDFTRQQHFTSPRTIMLHTKYDGAVAVNVWTGYAVQIVSKTGERQVLVGPATHLLEYDETLEPRYFSTGTPKTDANLFKTVYLRVLYNKVSDIITVETSDLCPVDVTLSYRVNFEGDEKRWFNVENYVKFLTDHLRSMLRKAIKQVGIEPFYANAITIIRDTILGPANEDGHRAGYTFAENGMRIYDVEVLDVRIDDPVLADLLVSTQHNTVQQALELVTARQQQTIIAEKETIKQQIAQAEAETQQLLFDLDLAKAAKQLSLTLAQINADIESQRIKLDAKTSEQAALDQINEAELTRQRAKSELSLTVADRQLAQRVEELRAEVEAVVSKAGAVSPQLVAALQSFSDKALAEKMAESMAPLAILGGKSVADVLAQLLKGTVLEQVLKSE